MLASLFTNIGLAVGTKIKTNHCVSRFVPGTRSIDRRLSDKLTTNQAEYDIHGIRHNRLTINGHGIWVQAFIHLQEWE
jgi:hypothetical protein